MGEKLMGEKLMGEKLMGEKLMGEKLMGENDGRKVDGRVEKLIKKVVSSRLVSSRLVSSRLVFFLFMKLSLISEVISDSMIIQNNQNLLILKIKLFFKLFQSLISVENVFMIYQLTSSAD